MKQTVNYAKYQQRLCNLEEKTKKLLEETGNVSLADKLNIELNNSKERQELKLAFIGQYSSGKSTIISALTGNTDIKIDANVATDTVSEYKWNNIVLMDTPGILAGKVEAHDERTKAALKECDLIFYVLTSQLFDDVLFKNFIDIAYNQHLADKIFIVVNKMGMEQGSFNALVDNYMTSLNAMFKEKGYDISSFPIAFIDANDYLEGVEDNDDEFVTLSNFEHFIEQLNSFVSKKGLIKKQFDTPVRILQSYVKNIAVSEVDESLADFYRQFEEKLIHSQKEIKRDIDNILYSFASTATAEVLKLSGQIGEIGEAEWNGKQNSLNESLKGLIASTSDQIETTINQNYENLMREINEFCSKDSLAQYYNCLEGKLNSPNISIEERKSFNTQKKTLEWLKNGANQISNMAPGVNDLFGGISQASGSQLHDIVLKIGHFFGKKFKPWEAVKWADNIAKATKFGVPVVSAGIDIWMQYREEKKENERREQIKQSKNQFVTEYETQFNKIKGEFEQYLQKILDNYRNKQNEINRSKDEILSATQRNEKINKSIRELEGEYVDFIEIINDEDN